MLSPAANKKERKIVLFTLKRNLLYQFVFFPLLFTLFTIIPLVFYSFINIFISAHLRNNLFNIILLNSVAIVISFFSALILAKRVRAIAPENSSCNRLATLVSLVLNALVVFIAYIIGGIIPAKITSYFANPLFILSNILFDFILENSIIMIMFVSWITYAATFLFFTNKVFAVQEKKQIKIFAFLTAVVILLSSASCTFAVYPEVEYEVLKYRYESLPFNEEVDYRFYENLPFDSNNKLVKLDEAISLNFTDIFTAPRLDGATAFYPVYAAIAENCYSGLKEIVEKNELSYYSDPWGDNIYLYIPYGEDNPLLERCAELIRCTQTTKAYNGLADGNSDIVFAFQPSADQIAYAASKGVEFELTCIGYDAFCFFVNKQNPIDNLSLKQVQDIYSGKITNWKTVGGKNKRIFAFTRPKNSGSQTIMENLVMKDININTRFQAKEVSTMGQIISVVDSYLNTPAAIGYTFMYYSSFMVTGESIKYLAIDGIVPTNDTVRSGAYIFSVPFYAVTVKGCHTQQTKQLLDWLKGQQGQRLIQKCGYVAL